MRLLRLRAREFENLLSHIAVPENSPTYEVIRKELAIAVKGMTGIAPAFSASITPQTKLIIGTPETLPELATHAIRQRINDLGNQGFLIDSLSILGRSRLVIVANDPVGALYGVFHLLRGLQSLGKNNVLRVPVAEVPRITHRLLNHWDNLDRTVERGYAGFSIWDWHRLPLFIDPRYEDYARANASIGINGTVLTNVNANALVLTPYYLEKVKALADIFRPYGIKVYLTARFSSPVEIGGLETADPLVPEVRKWWQEKSEEIYSYIPDFGGFLVKANSEGQPGPQNYERTHADGANMLAEAVTPFGGIVMWRAFVYSHEVPEDRAKQANNEFEPLDGKFDENVFIQVKNGAIDFQPREPFHPLFGKMPESNLALELQITQEYLGQATHLVYLGPLFEECLDSDTWANGKGSTVGKIVEGSFRNQKQSVIAGVANIGTDRNWTGHIFGQANWYAFGRLAWNHELESSEIQREWICQTFGDVGDVVGNVSMVMSPSREAVVNYMTPLGLHHIMGRNHHYGPGPWVTGGRPDWTSVYYHRADSAGIGFDRTAAGSNAVSQYAPEVAKIFADPQTCPEKYLLWFHHLPWDYQMKSGKTLWEAICLNYHKGVFKVERMRKEWEKLKGHVDDERHRQVSALLHIQENEARWWKNACLLYFQQFSGMPFPEQIEKPEGDLETYKNMQFRYAPGIRPRW